MAAPSLPSSLTGTAKEGFRSASHSSALGGNESLKVYGHPQRGHSLSIASKFNSDANPLIHFDNVEDRAPIPRLPSRQSSKSIESDSSTNSSRGPSLEFTYPSNPEILRRPPPPPSPSKVASRPPPRHSSLSVVDTDPFTAASECLSPSDSTTPTLQLPPPLPARKSPPPRAVSLAPPDLHETSHSAPPALERKSVANIQFAPPPVRTIALGDKLPPPRRQTSIEGSDSDSGEEDEPAVNLLPDATRASRRPPRATAAQFARANIPVPAHSGVIAVAGPRIVVGHHHVKVYDLFKSDKYMHNIDLKDAGFDWRGREIKITSVTFRSAEDDSEKGRFAWLGTKDGCLWELDTLSGVVKGLRPSIHGAPVTHILRHGLVMITIDDNGKALVFMPDAAMGGCTTMLTASNPRVIRLPEKQAFAKVLCGMLWTSGGPGSGSGNLQINGGSQVRGPVVRVCDFLSASTAVKSSIPSEQIGSVLSGTVLQAQPNKVFLGHEGGCVSIWQVNVDGPAPACVEVVKVSASDVLCLEGVMDRLWAGGRNGVISAFDVEHRPWVVTNNWKAHEDLPVLELFLDSYSIERCGQLSVISVGRDGVARFWDGLLGINWIGNYHMNLDIGSRSHSDVFPQMQKFRSASHHSRRFVLSMSSSSHGMSTPPSQMPCPEAMPIFHSWTTSFTQSSRQTLSRLVSKSSSILKAGRWLQRRFSLAVRRRLLMEAYRKRFHGRTKCGTIDSSSLFDLLCHQIVRILSCIPRIWSGFSVASSSSNQQELVLEM